MKRKPQAKILALTLAAVVVALVGGGAGRAAQAAVPSNTAPPTITGTPTVGSTLTTDNGTWTGSPTSYAYQWTRCNAAGGSCVNESNGTDKTYTLVPGDAHHTIRVKVTATNSDGSTTATSAQTAVVAPKAGTGTAPRNTSAPTVSGTTTVGQELDANPGTWNGNPTFSYQWERCDADVVICSDVPGAHGNTYGVRTADLGYRLRVLVTGRNSSGSATAPSAPTDVVAPVVKPKNQHPTIALISAKFVGAQIYARFRICDDSFKNVTGIARTQSFFQFLQEGLSVGGIENEQVRSSRIEKRVRFRRIRRQTSRAIGCEIWHSR